MRTTFLNLCRQLNCVVGICCCRVQGLLHKVIKTITLTGKENCVFLNRPIERCPGGACDFVLAVSPFCMFVCSSTDVLKLVPAGGGAGRGPEQHGDRAVRPGRQAQQVGRKARALRCENNFHCILTLLNLHSLLFCKRNVDDSVVCDLSLK